jgi:DGQHR domain-containing protein
LLRRSSVKRLQDSSSKAGYQRLLDKEKLKRMRKYLLQDFPIYPNNIICKLHDDATVNNLFDMGATVELGPTPSARTSILRDMKDNLFLVELPDTHDAFEIIDGQHRLFSFSQAKYAQYEKCKDAAEQQAFAEGDGKITNLSKSANLVVTAIHSKNATVTKFSSPGRLFLDINTTQTRIRPEDVIDLVGKFYQNDPAAHANVLLTKLNTHGVLKVRDSFYSNNLRIVIDTNVYCASIGRSEACYHFCKISRLFGEFLFELKAL